MPPATAVSKVKYYRFVDSCKGIMSTEGLSETAQNTMLSKMKGYVEKTVQC